MTPMLEKAARAVLDCDADIDDYFNRTLGQMLRVDPEVATTIARAVLMAVREPDEAMSAAVRSTEGWEAMIDAILSEGAK